MNRYRYLLMIWLCQSLLLAGEPPSDSPDRATKSTQHSPTEADSPEPSSAEASKAKRYVIGVQCAPLERPTRGSRNIDPGLQVLYVVPGSPGAVAGVRKGDVIVAAAGRPLRETVDLTLAVARVAPAEVALEIRRKTDQGIVDREVVVVPVEAERLRAVAESRTALLSVLRKRLAGTEQEALLPQVQLWLEQAGDEPFRMLQIHPGVLLAAARRLPPLPAGTTVVLVRQGDQPPQVSVKSGQRSWQGAASAWPEWTGDLPAEIRDPVRIYLRELLAPATPQVITAADRQEVDSAGLERAEARLARVEGELEALRAALTKMLKQRRKD